MKKVLIVITTGFYDYGGLTSVLMNYFRFLNKENLKIDFASTNVPEEEDNSYQELIRNGSNYYSLGNRKKHVFKYIKNLKTLLKNEKYDVIHINGNSATMIIELLVAKKCKIKKRIVHGHTSKGEYPIIHFLLRPILNKISTDRIAVSKKAGEWLYKNNYSILNNAINVDKYIYNSKVRKKIRDEYKLSENTIIMGHVGKLYAAKNHKFLIDVFKEYKKINSLSKLFLAGDGQLRDDLEKYADENNIINDVVFLGMKDNINELLQGFDLFVFPSLYEGLGMALIEAQASGLPCFASTNVPLETKITDNIIYLNTEDGAKTWAEKIYNFTIPNRDKQIKEIQNSISKNGFSIKNEAQKLERLYLND